MKDILITSSVLILALLILRRVFRGVLARRVQYALWGLVLARLLIPVSLPAADFSVLTAARPVRQAVEQRLEREAVRPAAALPAAPVQGPGLSEKEPGTVPEPATGDAEPAAPAGAQGQQGTASGPVPSSARMGAEQALRTVWAAGMVLMGGFFAVSNLGFYFRLRKNRRIWRAGEGGRRVYLVPEGAVSSPCLFGGAVYITPAVAGDPEKLRHVLAHEETHARHLDPLWSLLRCVCLTVYWFDPLVWAAAACSRTDCELACDEGALKRLGEAERIPYGQTLLSLIPVKRFSNPLLAATTMTAGKRRLKDRITRIAQKPRQLAAAALAAAVLAGIVSACTFTGGKTTQAPEESNEPPALTALSGEELRWFNEEFFNNGGAYTIRNQFANPVILYDRPEDIDLHELFYLEGSAPSDEELRTILDTTYDDLPCPAYKLTAAEMDEIFKANTGLTIAETSQKGLGSFRYDQGSDAYFWMHGDTNYCGELSFLCGSRESTEEGELVRLYHSGGLYCVTLLEKKADGAGTGGDGAEYRFVSNQACEQPAIPTTLPAGEPAAAISLKDLAPYAIPAAEVENRPAGDFTGRNEDRLAHWNFDGRGILVYRAADGKERAAVKREDGSYDVFLTLEAGEYQNVSIFHDLFGLEGFFVDHTGGAEDGPRRSYYYFTGDGSPALLLEADTAFRGTAFQLDLDGDGADELIADSVIFFQREGLIYRADLEALVREACPELGWWDQAAWDVYARRLYISGLTDWDEETGAAWWERYLYFDGENILVYRAAQPTLTDHVTQSAAEGAPAQVVEQARAELSALLVEQGDGTYRFAGNGEYDLPMDDWRLNNLTGPQTFTLGRAVLEVWSYGGMVHTTDPKKFVWAGGSYMDEEGWCAIDHSDFYGDLVYQMNGEQRTFLFSSSYRDGGLEAVGVREWFYRDLEEHGVDVSPTSYAALEIGLRIESLTYGDSVTMQPWDAGGFTFGLDEQGLRTLQELTAPELVQWARVKAPDQVPQGDNIILRDEDWYDMIQFWADSDLVMYKNTNDREATWYMAESIGDKSDVFYYRSRPYYQARSLLDEAEFAALREAALAADPRLAAGFTGDFKLQDWAGAWAAQYEAAHGQAAPGSSCAFSWQKVIEVEVADQTEDSMSIRYVLAFTPANEEAFRSCWAGNTSEYWNFPNPDRSWEVPEGALYYSRVLRLYKHDGVWSAAGYGTG